MLSLLKGVGHWIVTVPSVSDAAYSILSPNIRSNRDSYRIHPMTPRPRVPRST